MLYYNQIKMNKVLLDIFWLTGGRLWWDLTSCDDLNPVLMGLINNVSSNRRLWFKSTKISQSRCYKVLFQLSSDHIDTSATPYLADDTWTPGHTSWVCHRNRIPSIIKIYRILGSYFYGGTIVYWQGLPSPYHKQSSHSASDSLCLSCNHVRNTETHSTEFQKNFTGWRETVEAILARWYSRISDVAHQTITNQ